MKVRSGPSARMLGMGANCIARRVHQTANATNTIPAFGVEREFNLRATLYVNVPTPAESVRKSKLVKSDGRIVRRVTYK